MAAAISLRRVTGVTARLLQGPSPVERERAAAIDAAWRASLATKPRMFNGRVLLAESVEFKGDALAVEFRECAFATLVWLRGEGASETRLSNVFAAAAVVSRDGAVLLGRMAPHTANAGQVYFPCGTPDLGDIRGDVVDLEGSIVRELAEETGLSAPDIRPTANAIVVRDGGLLGLIRRFETDLDAEELAALAHAYLAAEREPELDCIVMARSVDDLSDEAPRFVRAALSELLGTDHSLSQSPR